MTITSTTTTTSSSTVAATTAITMIISCDSGEVGVGVDCGGVGLLVEVGLVPVDRAGLVEVAVMLKEAVLSWDEGEGLSSVPLLGPEAEVRERWTKGGHT